MKKLFTILFLLLFAGNGYCATQLEHTVEEDGNGDFTSLSAAVEHLESTHSNLVTADVYADIKICGTELGGNGWTNADTTAVTIHNITTSATCYINIYTTSTARHNGKAAAVSGRSSYRIIINVSEGTLIYISQQYLTLDGLELQNTNASLAHQIIAVGDNTSHYLVVKNCIVHDSICWPAAFTFEYVTNLNVYNNILYNLSKDSFNNGGAGIYVRYSGSNQNVVNNTVYNAYSYGFSSQQAVSIYNNIAYNCGTDFSGAITGNYNFSKDDTAPGANSIHGTTEGKTPDFVITASGSEDLHLQSSSDAIDAGTDLGSPYNTDIDGDTRSGTWDIGADEYVNPIQTNLIFNNVVLNYVIGN